MVICERIKSLRIKQGVTQRDLSVKLGVSVVSVRNWESGIRSPSMQAIISLSKLFGVTTDYLLGVSIDQDRDDMLLSRNETLLVSNYRTLDRYGKKAVDSICMIEKSRVESEYVLPTDNTSILKTTEQPPKYIPRYIIPSAAGCSAPLDDDDFEMILADNDVPSNADFAVRIQGDSMNPYIQDGDTVYVKKNCELSVGDIGIFCVNGAMYCKQYYIDKTKNLVLVSTNPRLKDTNIFISKDGNTTIKCYGKVITEQKIDLPNYVFE